MSALAELHSLLSRELEKEGFSICAPFPVKEYNKLAKKHPIRSTSDNAVGFVIGSGRSFWEPFLNWLPSPFPNDPVDAFTRTVMEKVLSEVSPFNDFEIRYDYHYPPNPKFVHVQTAAHLSGAAFYDQDVMWCVHAQYGVWCVFRAVVIFHDIAWEGPHPAPPQPLLSKEEKDEIARLSAIADEEGWKNHATLLRIRDSVNIGKEFRYLGHQLNYFYPIVYTKRQVLFEAKYERESNPELLKNWKQTSSFSGTRTSHACVCVDDKIFVIGGYGTDSYLNDVQFARIQEDGTLSDWIHTTAFEGARAGHSCVSHEGAIFLIGGYAESGYCNDVQRAVVDEDGKIEMWEKVSEIPRPQSHHTSFIFKARLNTYLYAVGGISEVGDSSVRHDDVLFCTVNPNGTLGEWKASPFHMKGGRSSHASYVWDDTLFVTGGWGDNLDDIYSDVQYTAIRQDGHVSPWRSSPYSLKVAVYGHAMLVANEKAICMGGNGNQGNIFDNVSVTSLNETGPRDWFWNRYSLPSELWGHQIVQQGNNVYLVGGQNKTGPVSAVYLTSSQATKEKEEVIVC